MLAKRSENKSIFFLKVIISLVNNKYITLHYRRTEGRRVIEHENIVKIERGRVRGRKKEKEYNKFKYLRVFLAVFIINYAVTLSIYYERFLSK